ncbi:MAG: hypothetical protein KGL39_28170 [Patescibacteria group bacterium]|nr:hypothetical protein [Patescibacteria group bacterium]
MNLDAVLLALSIVVPICMTTVAAVFSWKRGIEKKIEAIHIKFGAYMTNEEHNVICDRREEDLMRALKNINTKLDDAADAQQRVADTAQRLVTRVALIQQHLGLPIKEGPNDGES